MISPTPQATTNWYQGFTLAPFKEGATRINKFVLNTDYNQIDHPSLKPADRVFTLVIGLLFVIPVINAIIWIAMHILGQKEHLTVDSTPTQIEQWNEAIAAAEKSPELEIAAIQIPANDALPKKIEKFEVDSTVNSDPTYTSNCEIEYHKECIIVRSDSPIDSIDSIYSTDWVLQRMKYINKVNNVNVDMYRVGDTIRVVGNKGNEELDKEYLLPDPAIPWIQHPSIGPKPFVLSNENEMTFYAIDPRDMSLGKAKFTKTYSGKDAEHPEMGSTVKIETSATSFPASLLGTVCEAWYSVDKVKKSAFEYRSKWKVPMFYSSDSTIRGKIRTEIPSRAAVVVPVEPAAS